MGTVEFGAELDRSMSVSFVLNRSRSSRSQVTAASEKSLISACPQLSRNENDPKGMSRIETY